MSLDIVRVKVVDVEECSGEFIWLGKGYRGGLFSSWDSPIEEEALNTKIINPLKEAFKRETGILPVSTKRIGRNCLNEQWHTLDRLNSADDTWNEEDRDLIINQVEMRVVLPSEVEEKIFKYLDINEDEGMWFDKEELNTAYSFIYISW